MKEKPATAKTLTIGTLAAQSGVKAQTVRYYEDAGLLPAPPRTAGNQRLYGARDLERLRFIRRGRDLGFSLDDIRRLLRLAEQADAPCDDAHELAAAHLAAVREKIAVLRELESALARMAAGGDNHLVGDCRILEALGGHRRLKDEKNGGDE